LSKKDFDVRPFFGLQNRRPTISLQKRKLEVRPGLTVMKSKAAIAAFAASAGVWPHQKTWWGRMPNVKRIGWAIYAAGFVIWCFGYLSAGHASLIDWATVTPWWIASFVPNLEAEIGLALMFVSMIPIYWRRTETRA
jgi:hypothetical protein